MCARIETSIAAKQINSKMPHRALAWIFLGLKLLIKDMKK
jgi:hypothetical protein